jgi:hypothetical protein
MAHHRAKQSSPTRCCWVRRLRLLALPNPAAMAAHDVLLPRHPQAWLADALSSQGPSSHAMFERDFLCESITTTGSGPTRFMVEQGLAGVHRRPPHLATDIVVPTAISVARDERLRPLS